MKVPTKRNSTGRLATQNLCVLGLRISKILEILRDSTRLLRDSESSPPPQKKLKKIPLGALLVLSPVSIQQYVLFDVVGVAPLRHALYSRGDRDYLEHGAKMYREVFICTICFKILK
jgi:hypothetical protein